MADFTIGVYDYTIIDTENNYVRVQVHPNYKDLTQYPDVETTVTYDNEEYTVTDMTDCFQLCRFLINAPKLSDEVTNLTRCFAGCDSLQKAPPNINVEKVETMEGCFMNCKSLGSFSSFSLSHYPVLTNMEGCFMGCTSLSTCRQAFPKTITNMRICFYDCKNLSNTFSTFPAFVEDIRGCFENCESLAHAPGLKASIKEMSGCFRNCISLKGNLIIGSCDPEDTQFSNTYFNNVGELYLLGPSNNPELAEKWRQIASYYKRVHYEADDHPAPQIILKAIRTDNEKNPQTDGSYVLITKGYTISQDYLPSGWSAQAKDEKIIQDNDETQPIYVPPGSLVDLDIFSINEDPHTYTYSLSDGYKTNEITINLPRVLALLDFQGKSGKKYVDRPGMGMSIGKKAVRNGLDINFPTTIGKDLLPPTIWSLTSDITVDSNKTYYEKVNDEYIEVENPSGNPHALEYYNATVDLENYQLVVGQYNKINNDVTFIIGNGSDDNNRSNLMEVGDIITLGSSDGTQSAQVLDYHSLRLFDKENMVLYSNPATRSQAIPYVWLSDLRDKDGVHIVEDAVIGSGNYYIFATFDIFEMIHIYIDEVEIPSSDYTLDSSNPRIIRFNNTIQIGADIKLTYKSKSDKLKAYTLGLRKSSSTIGAYSLAEGFDTTASGNYSHAEGYGTTASGSCSHAEGYGAIARGTYSHAEGSGTTTASGDYSHAEGGGTTTASGGYSHAEGRDTTASGSCSHAEGYNTTASGTHSHAEGGGATTASGGFSHAEGCKTTASGNYSHAEGYATRAKGDYSHAEGGGAATASGDYSHAEGYNTTASSDYSHAEGYTTRAKGDYSHAEGYLTESSGINSHAEGYGTKAKGGYSHAEGYGTTASGDYSHAEGGGAATAGGMYSHAQNKGTIAAKDCQTAIGRYNVEDTESVSNKQKAFIIGNGSNDTYRSNAFTIDWNGNVQAQGWAGFIQMYAGATAPDGWLFCDGSEVAIADYPALYAVIENTYGTPSDSNHFLLPDLRGRAPIGAGQGANLSNRTLGKPVGAETHQLTINEMPSHRHKAALPNYHTQKTVPVGTYIISDTQNTNAYTEYTGGGQPHNNMQPSLGLNFIICTGKTS